jgi:hypothetical protein
VWSKIEALPPSRLYQNKAADQGLLAVCNHQFIPHVEEGDSEGDCFRFELRENEIGSTRPVHRHKIARPCSRRLSPIIRRMPGLSGQAFTMVLNPVVAFGSKSGLEKRDIVRLLAAFDALDSVYFFSSFLSFISLQSRSSTKFHPLSAATTSHAAQTSTKIPGPIKLSKD